MAKVEPNTSNYFIDIDAIMKWISTSPPEEHNVETTITEMYGMDDEENDYPQKEITEHKAKINDSMSSMRYSIVNSLLERVLSEGALYDDCDDGMDARTLAVNTMCAFGLIKRVEVNLAKDER